MGKMGVVEIMSVRELCRGWMGLLVLFIGVVFAVEVAHSVLFAPVAAGGGHLLLDAAVGEEVFLESVKQFF